MSTFEAGHEFIYRLTATRRSDGEPLESQYYVSAHKARFWRNELRETGYEAKAARVPASAFEELDDAELDALADEEKT